MRNTDGHIAATSIEQYRPKMSSNITGKSLERAGKRNPQTVIAKQTPRNNTNINQKLFQKETDPHI